MAHLIKIGNSQGIRIPKPLIKQANLQNKEFEIQVVDNGLLITPIKKTRQGWKEQFKSIAVSQIEQDFNEIHRNLDHCAELATGEAWEW
ncbi:MAG: AbrB/MazE/SpoVT family DNA-binding domain-containing protein [Methylococcaceae bacterium]